jgi:Putative zinc-finger
MSGTARTITCDEFTDRLMDLLEGDVDDATRAAMEAHAHECAECRALLADLRRVSHDASRLPMVTPSHDLWTGIAARIETPVVGLAGRRPAWRSPRLVGLAAAAVIVAAAGLGYRVAARNAAAVDSSVTTPVVATHSAPIADTPRSAPPRAAPAAAGRSVDSARAALASNRAAGATSAGVEETYDGEIAGLRAIIKRRHGQLDTATVAVLERNLAVIDSAIAQCKTALAKDPKSRFLMQSLSQSLDIKVQLLRMTAALPSAT